ncbi:ADP-ribosylation factor-like protein 2-binding protein [Micropterus salmoides]|uniref:ADP-ribosylation factor-like protein 2-binding protein n=1 Tax=Micropterus salmoides TaxID=27706 RepID=UPI0018EB9B3C|nr:ADP-ribosylation factor-like protein 2-binding protein [Micropterus salmoides]XP_038561678.1 ADP-ribosylation factor-like protein 2-binding protein [Micropterus salmoides]XP_045894005.1 ADP-ribosylation factor-like protein 2-binding protein [Micropterus dolomieu]
MDIKGRNVLSCGENIVDMVDMEEENFAISSSSAADAAFDAVIGCIEDIIMEEEFQQLQKSFLDKHYLEFDDSDENKLSYTPIFNAYVDLLEKHLEQQLMEKIPGFTMNAFTELLVQHKEEVPDDIFDMLLTFTDFMAFKEMFLAYRAEIEGRGLDLSQGLVITSLVPTGSKLTHTKSQ